MKHIPLGTTDLRISQIALGCIGLTHTTGVTLWNTANADGGGTSEERNVPDLVDTRHTARGRRRESQTARAPPPVGH